MAACSIANIVKSSLGPVGLDKMLVDDIGVCIVLGVRFNAQTTLRTCINSLYYIIQLSMFKKKKQVLEVTLPKFLWIFVPNIAETSGN